MAQTNIASFFLKGSISDSLSHSKLPFVTIKINNGEGKTIKAGVSMEDGAFNFPDVSPSSYRIEIIATGYEPKILSVNLQKDTDLGQINLKQQVNVLNEVSITANMPIIKQKADRIVYDLQADPESKSNSVLGMMHKIPYISLDGSDNIMLKGNSSFKVLINGKPSASVENNLNTILKSMPASTIEKIEVITTPPSKYDGEGLTGIINIITVKKLNDGYSGSLNANGNFPVGGPGLGGSFTAKTGKFAISAYGGGSLNYNPQTTYINNRSTFGSNPTSLLQQGINKSNNKSAYFGTEMSLEIDSIHLISAQLNLNGNHSNTNRTQMSALRENNILTQAYDLFSDNQGNVFGIDAAINYQIGFKAVKDRLLTFSYQFSDNQNNRDDQVATTGQLNFNTPDYQQHDSQRFNEHTMQVDFITPVKKVNIEAGLKAILRNSNSDFGYNSFNSFNNVFEPDPALSNQYTNTQNVFSAYNSYQINLNSWNINAGLRVEGTMIRADFISNNTATDQNYLNFLPSVAIGKNFKNSTSLNFGFSQRIRRPGINRLNPYIDRSNPNFEVTGNPNLRPVLINDFQIGYGLNKKVSLNIGINYSFMNNLDLQVIDFDPATQITRTSYANTGRSSNLGGNLSFSYPISKTYSINLNGNATYLWLEGIADGKIVNNNRLMYSFNLSNGFRFVKGWAVNADLNVISRNPTGLQGYSNGFVGTAFSVNKELIKNKLIFAAQVKNPFTKFRDNIVRSFGPDFNQVYTSQDYFRSFGLSLNYKFGGLNGGINKSKKSIRNNDLAN
ncbi:TonB-dependent receptor [Pedobacter sp. PF22-3]|uniref:outer membrane beta-barrel protein n=1 Tax=Pedobacter sp. PF22-3 TaxID=2994467 RepID=UPI002246273E|nr:outer membrane beta-barrel protein [Pedobacter sp. PF22-3]MCX2492874.1 TonB-dependent receptor [Pedobacter sp. PF22-3]